MTIQIDTDSLARLRASVTGTVFVRGDAGLAAEVAGFNPTLVHDPDVVVAVTSEEDVAAAVRFAAENGLRVRVQATGHGGGLPITDGVLISTRALDEITIDPEAGLATIGAGCRWAPVIEAGSEYGLAPITGSSPHVGAVGYTLGGGLGPLSRSHGFTADWVRAFRVVTADGEIVTADDTSHRELFWALRGGKGGLGVVTSMTIELVPLKTLYAGSLIFEGDSIEPALRTWVEWAQSAPDLVTSSFAFIDVPDVEFAPPPLRGKFVLSIRFAFPGDPAEGARLASPLRESAPVSLDLLGEIPTTAVGTIHNDPEAGGPDWIRGLMLDSIDQDLADELLRLAGPGSGTPFAAVEVRQLGGATRRDPADGTSVGGRDAQFTMGLIALDPSTFAERAPERAQAIFDAVGGRRSAITNVNWSRGLIDPAEFTTTWPPAVFDRLAAARTTYDPSGVFAFGPAAE
ncbi:FAD-binding oxidoreductase [Diaminobutyricibacter sp. McL0608]|uniref:FAD-binding oxidoreductase n=1 Tax=Leifsonia sp. McL0608 TaxID=3143537 RepID=UPI0031F32CF0